MIFEIWKRWAEDEYLGRLQALDLARDAEELAVFQRRAVARDRAHAGVGGADAGGAETLRHGAPAVGRVTARNLDRPELHRCYVQTISGGGFFASCPSCGCDPFPNRETAAEASVDGARHEAEVLERASDHTKTWAALVPPLRPEDFRS